MTCTDVTKPERSQRQFVALCQYRFCTYDRVTYEDCLKFLNLHTLHNTRLYLDTLFLLLSIPVYNVARLFWILPVLWVFLVLLETPLCVLLDTRYGVGK